MEQLLEILEDLNPGVDYENCEDLIDGHYWLDVTIESGAGIPVDYYKRAVEFDVASTRNDVGISRIQHEWSFMGVKPAVDQRESSDGAKSR